MMTKGLTYSILHAQMGRIQDSVWCLGVGWGQLQPFYIMPVYPIHLKATAPAHWIWEIYVNNVLDYAYIMLHAM